MRTYIVAAVISWGPALILCTGPRAVAAEQQAPVQPEVMEVQPKTEPGLADTAREQTIEAMGKVKDGAGDAWDATKQGAGKVVDWSQEKAGKAWDATKQGAGQAVDWSKDKAGQAWDATRESTDKVVDWTQDNAEKAWDATTGAAKDTSEAVRQGC